MKKIRLGPLPDLLAEKGVSPKDLARVAGVEPRAINHLIEGKTKDMARDKLHAIAEALETDPGDLYAKIVLQRDIRGLLRLCAGLGQLNVTLTHWRPPESPDARQWAPADKLIDSVLDQLGELRGRGLDIPPKRIVRPSIQDDPRSTERAEESAP